jgi:hypothetical protein
VDDDIEVYTDDTRSEVLTRFHHLRQQAEKKRDGANNCLSDFVAPKDSGVASHIGLFVVTASIGIDEHVAPKTSPTDCASRSSLETGKTVKTTRLGQKAIKIKAVRFKPMRPLATKGKRCHHNKPFAGFSGLTITKKPSLN